VNGVGRWVYRREDVERYLTGQPAEGMPLREGGKQKRTPRRPTSGEKQPNVKPALERIARIARGGAR